MIRKLAVLIIAALVTGLGASLLMAQTSSRGANPERFDADTKSNITFDFSNARIRVDGWDKNYIEVKSSIPLDTKEYEKKFGEKFKIRQDDNKFTLEGFNRIYTIVYEFQPSIVLYQFKDQIFKDIGTGVGMNTVTTTYDFTVKVPKDTPVQIKANSLKASNCTVAATNAEDTTIRESILPKGFVSEGESITVRDCKVSKDSNFKNKNLNFRDNTNIED